MQRTDFFQENCPTARILDLVGEWCGVLARREECVLTEMGGDLVTVVAAMLQWGDRWLILPGASLSRMIETATGHPVAKREATSSDGRRIGLAELA